MFWIHASNTARFEAAYKEVADRLRLPGRDDATVNVLQLVCNWLRSEACERWFMILDNADDESVFYTQREHGHGVASGSSHSKPTLASFLPQSQNGSILITSRHKDVALKLTGRDKDIIRIQHMDQNQGLALLRNKLSHPLDEPVSELLDALDYMPLAITQAAAHINKHWPRTTISSYTRELRISDKKREKLLSQAAMDLRRDEEASNSILATWYMSFENLREESPSAANLLSFMSFFNPQGIPDFLLKGYSSSELNTKDESDDEDVFEDDLNILRSYSFVTTDLNGHVFQMHRLVKFATRTWLRSFGGENRWRRKFLATLYRVFPSYTEFENWSQCRVLLPHVEPLVDEEPIDTEEAKFWAQILYNAASYMWHQGMHTKAEEMIQGSISARTRILGAEHSDTLDSVSVLPIILQTKGKYEEAEQITRRVLESAEKVRGEEHSDTLYVVHNLGLALCYQGKYEEAELMYRRVLEGFEKALGKEHPHSLTSASNLAQVLRCQGKYDEAEQMHRRVLERTEKVRGKEHPDTTSRAVGLANVLWDRGKYEEAEQMHRRALEGREKTLGKAHPDTLMSINNLAVTLLDQGKYGEAEQMCRRALEGREKILGKEHPDTLWTVSNLASIRRNQRKYEEAEQLNRQALEGLENALGKEHPTTLWSLFNLALLYRQCRRYDAASEFYQRACDAYQKTLGPNHPHTVACCDSFSEMVQEMGKSKKLVSTC